MKKKILVADKIAAAGVAALKANKAFEVIEAVGTPADKLPGLVADVSAILVRSETQITKEVLAAAKKLECVGRAGVGVDNIDLEAATERGVIVMNTPSGNTIATAELTFTHLLCTARPVPNAHKTMREGKWDRKLFSGIELYQKTLGVLGLGRIGAEVAKRALAFGMTVLAYDPYLTESRAKSLGVKIASLDEVFANADFITVHMPLTEQTKDMVNAAAFAKMKKGVRIVNVARGGIINEKDLADALKTGKVAFAGLDVFEVEPMAADNELRALQNLNLTPHLGASTTEAQENVGVEIADAVARVLEGGPAENAVNMPTVDRRALEQLRPYLGLAEKLGFILQQLAEGQGRVEKLRITVEGRVTEFDTLPLNRAVQRGYLRNIAGALINDVNAPHILKRQGVSVELTQSNNESDYKDYIQVEAHIAGGKSFLIGGTVVGKAHSMRVVNINGHNFEFSPEGPMLVLENKDVPGIVGSLGTILGMDKVNIANLALSRTTGNATALAVYVLDTPPSDNALNLIRNNPAILSARVLRV